MNYNGLETFFTAREQTELFLLSCLFGALLGILYELPRAVIKDSKTLFTIILDALLAILYAFFVSGFSIVYARGEFRFFYIAGNALGFLVYYFTLGRVLRKPLLKLARGIKWLFRQLIQTFAAGFRFAAKTARMISKKPRRAPGIVFSLGRKPGFLKKIKNKSKKT